MAVVPACKGKGVGDRLQAARLDEMRRRGFRTVRSETDNAKVATWLKRKYGFREVGTSPKKHAFGLAGVDRWIVLERDLTAP